MKNLKHSKFKNTGVLFELLVRQVASDTLNNNDSKAIPLIKKYFAKSNELAKELNLYQTLVKEKFSKEYDNNPALKGGQKGLPDELQKSIIKKSVTEEADYEGEMAKSELRNIIQNAEELFNMLDEDTQLEAWVQSKLTKANEYLESVYQYLKYQSIPQPEQMDEREALYTLDK
jgi:hypothetical protein